VTLPHVAWRELSFPALARLTAQGKKRRLLDRSHVRETGSDCGRLDIAKHHASGAEPLERPVAADGMQQQRLSRFHCLNRRKVEQAEAVDVHQEVLALGSQDAIAATVTGAYI